MMMIFLVDTAAVIFRPFRHAAAIIQQALGILPHHPVSELEEASAFFRLKIFSTCPCTRVPVPGSVKRRLSNEKLAALRQTEKIPATFMEKAGQERALRLLTTEPNDVVRSIHPKAMPVILHTPEEVETWLDAPAAEALALQRPLPDGVL